MLSAAGAVVGLAVATRAQRHAVAGARPRSSSVEDFGG